MLEKVIENWTSRLDYIRASRGSPLPEIIFKISPYLNPIEHLWDILDQSGKGHHAAPTNLTELWTALANIWQVIPEKRFQKLVEPMPHRVAAVVKLNGYVNKQNCRIRSEANPQVYVETPLHPEKLTVWCALWAGGILLQKR
ncbi:transposable element Tcb2 transposase [Trichonephila clavipes]|nr:transposable element Tcb2 transposase [Trichonephila clavipes]